MDDYSNKLVRDLTPGERASLWYDILAEYQKTQETKPAFLPVILKVEMLAEQVEALKSEIVSLDQILDKHQGCLNARANHLDCIDTDLTTVKQKLEALDLIEDRLAYLEELHVPHMHLLRHKK